MRRLMLLSLLCLALFGGSRPVHAQTGEPVENVRLWYDFGVHITFLASLPPGAQVASAEVFLRREGEEITRATPAQLQPDGSLIARYEQVGTLRPFGRILFWFAVRYADGRSVLSREYSFRYVDNRFPWQTLESGLLRVHWYDGDALFGQAALDSARAGLRSLGDSASLTLSAPVDIYLYNSADTLHATLDARDWVAGHASPELGVAVVAIPPGEAQTIAMQTQIPHELAHLLLYQALGPDYDRLPVWLREGLAVSAEVYPNPDFDRVLQLAYKSGGLLPLNQLCATFPLDASRAFLSYAEAYSFVTWLRQNYGESGLWALFRAYADGLDCEAGPVRALGLGLPALEARWREQVFGENRLGMAFRQLAPYGLLLLLVLAAPLAGVLQRPEERRKDGRSA